LKIDWKIVWITMKSVLSVLVTLLVIAFLSTMICYYISAGSNIVVHDNGCERIMNVYSQTGELLESYEGFIGIIRMDGNTVVYDWEGSCVTIQGAIVTVQDYE